MVEITNFRQGAVLNHNHGTETEKALTINLEGISSSGYPVYVNGIKADMDGQRFEVQIDLTEKINTVKAVTTTTCHVIDLNAVIFDGTYCRSL